MTTLDHPTQRNGRNAARRALRGSRDLVASAHPDGFDARGWAVTQEAACPKGGR